MEGITSGIHDENGLCDVVSVLISCDDGTYLLTSPNKGKELYWIFSSPARSLCWRSVARNIVLENYGVDTRDEKLEKLYNIWVPGDSNLHHVIFEVKLTSETKRRNRLLPSNMRGRWFSAPDMHVLATKRYLRSPELLDYVPGLKKRQGTNFPGMPDGCETKPYLSSNDPLVELFEEHVIVRTDNEVSGYDVIVKVANFFQREQIMIYREFLSLCFPNILMNQYLFEFFMTNFGWESRLTGNLFYAADICDKGALTFKEFLYILAACEPKTPHGGKSADIRCRYMFRLFDGNKDNRLDYEEMRNMYIAMNSSKKGQLQLSTIDRDVDVVIKDLGLPPKAEVNLATFIRGISEMKIRGTSTLLRSPLSVIDYLVNRARAPYMSLVDSAAGGLFKTRGTSPDIKKSAKLSVAVLSREFDPGYHICSHIANITKEGLESMTPIDDVANGKTLSATTINLMKSDSKEFFNTHFPPNEIITALHYFAERIDVIDSKQHGRKPKPAYNWGQVDLNGFGNCLIDLCQMLVDVVGKEPRLIRINSPVYVFGDIHGNFADLVVFESLLWKQGPHLCPHNILFLGDYVDRGSNSVEVVSYLFSYKLLNTKKLVLVRGNHEIKEVQTRFTFYQECLKKFGKELGNNVWENVNKVFDCLPIASVIDKKIFCCHGGIPPPWVCPTIECINSIPVPLSNPEEQSLLAWEIMWSDPVHQRNLTDKVTSELKINEGFAVNTNRNAGHFFSVNALNKFLSVNELSHVIRAHEAMSAGFQIHQNGKLITVFSSSHYGGGNNEAACIQVFKKELRVFRFSNY